MAQATSCVVVELPACRQTRGRHATCVVGTDIPQRNQTLSHFRCNILRDAVIDALSASPARTTIPRDVLRRLEWTFRPLDSSTVVASPYALMCGGKGGLLSQLRAQAARMAARKSASASNGSGSSTTTSANIDSCRTLRDGVRIKTAKEQDFLRKIETKDGQPHMGDEKKEKAKRRLKETMRRAAQNIDAVDASLHSAVGKERLASARTIREGEGEDALPNNHEEEDEPLDNDKSRGSSTTIKKYSHQKSANIASEPSLIVDDSAFVKSHAEVAGDIHNVLGSVLDESAAEPLKKKTSAPKKQKAKAKRASVLI